MQNITHPNFVSSQIEQLTTAVVHTHNGTPATNSLVIADRFNKRHDNVLRAIKNLECSSEFAALNFEGADFIDKNGDSRPYFIITRDGFMFLAMGFTGKEAALWKEKFINAFNELERLQREPKRQIDITDHKALQYAHHAALDYFSNYRKAVDAGKSFAEMDRVPDEVLLGLVAEAFQFKRFFISFDHSAKMHMKMLDYDDCILKYKELPRLITDPANMLGAELLVDIGNACITRLGGKVSGLVQSNKALRENKKVLN